MILLIIHVIHEPLNHLVVTQMDTQNSLLILPTQ